MIQGNSVKLVGTLINKPKPSHSLHGEDILEATIAVVRKSGAIDELQLHIPDSALNVTFDESDIVSIVGTLRSYSKEDPTTGKNRIALVIFVEEIGLSSEIDENEVCLEGFLCKINHPRVTPEKREVCDFTIAIPRHYNKSDYIPAIIWGRKAKCFDTKFVVGDKVKVFGRFQSRKYKKPLEDFQRTAFELSVCTIEIIEESSRRSQQ